MLSIIGLPFRFPVNSLARRKIQEHIVAPLTTNKAFSVRFNTIGINGKMKGRKILGNFIVESARNLSLVKMERKEKENDGKKRVYCVKGKKGP